MCRTIKDDAEKDICQGSGNSRKTAVASQGTRTEPCTIMPFFFDALCFLTEYNTDDDDVRKKKRRNAELLLCERNRS